LPYHGHGASRRGSLQKNDHVQSHEVPRTVLSPASRTSARRDQSVILIETQRTNGQGGTTSALGNRQEFRFSELSHGRPTLKHDVRGESRRMPWKSHGGPPACSHSLLGMTHLLRESRRWSEMHGALHSNPENGSNGG
jgi:hypothetical protein